MAYQALYRQWRPVDFSHMVAQESIITTLRNQIMTGRIAHAYLFCGSRGTGKTSTAKIMARAINCESPVNGDPCCQCESCRRLLADESLDVMEIDAASNNGVDEIRDLRETVKYPPQYGKYKVYIIDEVHMLSASAFNALLKTLEEPPAHVVFILATTEPQKLPATILSRCQRYDFGRIPAAQIAGRLKEAVDGANATASNGALMLIARAAEGGMRDALSILDMCLGYSGDVTEELVHKVLGTSDISFLFRFGDALAEEDPSQVLLMIDELMRSGREPQVFSKDVSRHLRALMMARLSPDNLGTVLEIADDAAQQYIRQAEKFTTTRLMEMLEHFMNVETALRWTSAPRVALEAAALKACLRTTPADQFAMNERIDELQKQLEPLQKKLASMEEAVRSGRVTTVPAVQAPAAREERKEAPAVNEALAKPVAEGKSPEEIMKAALEIIKREEPGTFSILRNGRLVGYADGTFRWLPGDSRHVEYLNVPVRNDRIANALKKVSGMDCAFVAVSPEEKKDTGAAAQEEKTIGELTALFGKSHMTVQD